MRLANLLDNTNVKYVFISITICSNKDSWLFIETSKYRMYMPIYMYMHGSFYIAGIAISDFYSGLLTTTLNHQVILYCSER